MRLPSKPIRALLLVATLVMALAVSSSAVGQPPPDRGRPARPIIGAERLPLERLPQIENFQVVGETIIPNPDGDIERGRNGGIAIANDCLYVGNRLGRRSGTGPDFGTPEHPPEVAIVDISNPRRPQVVSYLETILHATSREVRAFGAPTNTLFVQNFRQPPGVESDELNNIQIYDVSDCRQPALTATIRLDGPDGPDDGRPHEFFVWQDPVNPGRFLLYVSFSGGSDVPDLRVYEVLDPPSGPASSTPIATFTLDPATPRVMPVDPDRWDPEHLVFQPARPATVNTNLHSMSVSDDGSRVYMASRHAFYIVDSSNLADPATAEACSPHTVTVDETTNEDPNLCLRKVNPDPDAVIGLHPPYRGITHTAVPLPGRPYVVMGGERNGTTTCPWTWGWIAHIVDETNPQVVSRFMVPENLAQNCVEGGPGDPVHQREFSSHQVTAFPNLFFISWYSAGLRAWDVFEPNVPKEVGVWVPEPRADVVERFRDSPDVWVWPYPIVHNGLIYIADENGGLYILRYRGQRADEVPQVGTFQGNATAP